MDLSVDELQSELASREEIIMALTARLEETAEQLDRIQRSGGVRGGSGGGGGPEQTQINAKLLQFLGDWEETETTDRILKIEEGVEEILRQLSEGVVAAAAPREAAPPASRPSAPPVAKKKQEKAAEEPADEEDFWAAAKARLMGASTEESSSPKSEPPPEKKPDLDSAPASPSDAAPPDKREAAAPAEEPIEIPPMPEPPIPVEPGAPMETLVLAVDQRDQFIQYLIARTRAAERRQFERINLSELRGDQEELVTKLKELETQLLDQLKQAEISNSLERAALARERAKLYQVKQHLENQVRRLGAHVDESAKQPEEDPQARMERRWGGIFSKKQS